MNESTLKSQLQGELFLILRRKSCIIKEVDTPVCVRLPVPARQTGTRTGRRTGREEKEEKCFAKIQTIYRDLFLI